MKRYTKEFKLEAVELSNRPGMSIRQAARDLGISGSNLGKWRKQFAENGADSFPGKGRLTPQDEELRRLKRENATLRMERDILKKATAFFAKHGS